MLAFGTSDRDPPGCSEVQIDDPALAGADRNDQTGRSRYSLVVEQRGDPLEARQRHGDPGRAD